MESEAVEIKKLGASDAALLSAIATEAYSEHYGDTWYDDGQWYMKTFFNAERLTCELQDPKARFFAVYKNAKAVGFLKINLDKAVPGEHGRAVELERIYLTKSAAGKGIGTQLLHFVFDVAARENYHVIWLAVMQSSPAAVAFYKKLGFEVCGTRSLAFVQKKEGLRDMFVMRRCI